MQMSSIDAKGRGSPPGGPRGGYEAISVTQLAMAWWAYQSGLITKLMLRAYFGCWELETRRRLSGGSSAGHSTRGRGACDPP
jgi:hypothetical protein